MLLYLRLKPEPWELRDSVLGPIFFKSEITRCPQLTSQIPVVTGILLQPPQPESSFQTWWGHRLPCREWMRALPCWLGGSQGSPCMPSSPGSPSYVRIFVKSFTDHKAPVQPLSDSIITTLTLLEWEQEWEKMRERRKCRSELSWNAETDSSNFYFICFCFY